MNSELYQMIKTEILLKQKISRLKKELKAAQDKLRAHKKNMRGI